MTIISTLLPLALWLNIMFRINKVYEVRTNIPANLYLNLPSFEAMVYNPRYWLMWTNNQWVKKINN